MDSYLWYFGRSENMCLYIAYSPKSDRTIVGIRSNDVLVVLGIRYQVLGIRYIGIRHQVAMDITMAT